MSRHRSRRSRVLLGLTAAVLLYLAAGSVVGFAKAPTRLTGSNRTPAVLFRPPFATARATYTAVAFVGQRHPQPECASIGDPVAASNDAADYNRVRYLQPGLGNVFVAPSAGAFVLCGTPGHLSSVDWYEAGTVLSVRPTPKVHK
jgi:hypothetical protein